MPLSECLNNTFFWKIDLLVCKDLLFFSLFLTYAFSLLLPLKRMIYSRVMENSGRILLPQNDKIRMYVITLGFL